MTGWRMPAGAGGQTGAMCRRSIRRDPPPGRSAAGRRAGDDRWRATKQFARVPAVDRQNSRGSEGASQGLARRQAAGHHSQCRGVARLHACSGAMRAEAAQNMIEQAPDPGIAAGAHHRTGAQTVRARSGAEPALWFRRSSRIARHATWASCRATSSPMCRANRSPRRTMCDTPSRQHIGNAASISPC